MTVWLLAVVAGIAIALLLYAWREPREAPRRAPLIALRALALTLLIALVLDAPAGGRRAVRPVVALDVSASWLRDADTAAWRDAVRRVRALGGDSLLVFGDSVRRGAVPVTPSDAASRVGALAERALGAGRPVVLVTDGELDDPLTVSQLPAGSRVDVIPRAARRDAAAVLLDAPRAIVSGDTLEARVTIRNGAVASGTARLTLLAGPRAIASATIDSLSPWAERAVMLRAPFVGAPGPSTLGAVVMVDGDADHRNDTVAVPVDVARAAGAVLASTSPDEDARFLVPILRGAVALPTRAYFRVAPGQWRAEGTLAPVSESTVREALHDAPLAILHGDTALFGNPRTATTGSLALVTPATDSTGEWYAVAAPPSPIAGALSGLTWDSLPPLATAPVPRGGWDGLLVARARQYDRRPVITGSEGGRRVVVVGASGLWRWAFRGGGSADAFAAVWGSIFDWLSAERNDPRAAIPAEGVLRAGERVRWRRGSGTDSLVIAIARRRGATREDSIALRFGPGGSVAESDPMSAGVYDVRVPGGAAVLVVNVSRELLPRSATVHAGAVGGAATFGDLPRLRARGWAYLLLLAALCLEWVLRRRHGLR